MTVAQLVHNLPASSIKIKDGRVVEYSIWTLWNGRAWNTLLLKRRASDFFCAMGSPDGGGQVYGTLDHVVDECFCSKAIGDRIKQLFMLDEPTGRELKELGCI